MNEDKLPGPGLPRRLAAAFYDLLPLIAIWMLAAFLALLLTGRGAMPLGEAVPAGAWTWLFRLYLLGVSFAFLGWFWVHGGQTAGLKAWRLKLVTRAGGPVSWRRAGLRFLAALPAWLLLGLGVWWSLFDRDRLAWQDRLSGTRLVLLPRPRGGGRAAADKPPRQ